MHVNWFSWRQFYLIYGVLVQFLEMIMGAYITLGCFIRYKQNETIDESMKSLSNRTQNPKSLSLAHESGIKPASASYSRAP